MWGRTERLAGSALCALWRFLRVAAANWSCCAWGTECSHCPTRQQQEMTTESQELAHSSWNYFFFLCWKFTSANNMECWVHLELYQMGVSAGLSWVFKKVDGCNHKVGYCALESILKCLTLKLFINARLNETVGDNNVFRTWGVFQCSCFCCSDVPFLVQKMLSQAK